MIREIESAVIMNVYLNKDGRYTPTAQAMQHHERKFRIKAMAAIDDWSLGYGFNGTVISISEPYLMDERMPGLMVADVIFYTRVGLRGEFEAEMEASKLGVPDVLLDGAL